MLFQPDMNYL